MRTSRRVALLNDAGSYVGPLEELASFCMPFIDGTSRFTTGQFVAYAGGWA